MARADAIRTGQAYRGEDGEITWLAQAMLESAAVGEVIGRLAQAVAAETSRDRRSDTQ
jgi:hypothetical protein